MTSSGSILNGRSWSVVPPEQGRVYAMGRMCAIFKADSDESAGRYSVSEWRLEPRTRGAEVHPEDHVFFVIAGTLSLRVNDDWTHVTKGTYVIIPGGTLTPLRIKPTFRSMTLQNCSL